MINKEQVTLGFDPEFFIYNEEQNIYVSGLDYPFGSKGNGEEVCPGCKVENDNVSIEVVLPPVPLLGGVDEAWNNYKMAKEIVESRLPEEYRLDCCSSYEFTDEEIANPIAQEMGCSIDFNAWNGGNPNPKPQPKGNGRCAGGHVHCGFPNLTPKNALHVVKLYDLFVTVPLVIMDPDTERRKLYGMAGSFRMTPEKVECRSSPNFIWSSREVLQWLFDQIIIFIDYYNENGIEKIEEYKDLIISTINNSEVENAYKLCELFNINIPVEA